jgi:hypothetical protein
MKKYMLKYIDYPMTPKYVTSEVVEAASPLHAGLLFAKMSVAEKNKVTIGMVVNMVNGGDYEVHAKKNRVNGMWIFHGQVYKDKSPFNIT